MVWWIIFILLLSFFTWLIVGPLILKINTSRNIYEIKLPGIFKGMIIPTDEFLVFKIWFAFIPITFDPLKQSIKKNKKPKKEKSVKKSTKKKSRKKIQVIQIRKLIVRIFNSFNIKKLDMNIDTGDFILNAKLVPVFSAIHSEKRMMTVNFQEVNHLELIITNRLFNFIKIAIKTFVFKS